MDEVSGVVRFGEDAIGFDSGSIIPLRSSGAAMRKIADILAEELACFTLGEWSTIADDCNPNASIIEAVQIEGHTDTDGSLLSNLELSTKRATSTYRVFVRRRGELEQYLNANYMLENLTDRGGPGQQVLSVSGYGETRPVSMGETVAAKKSNRRIDIRFIMTTPKNIKEIEKIKAAVQNALKQRDAAE